MPPAAFEPTAPASDRQQTHALNRSATGMGDSSIPQLNIVQFPLWPVGEALIRSQWTLL